MCAVHSYFFFNDTATTEIYTLSLHDALPICRNEIESAAQSIVFSATVASSGDGPKGVVISDNVCRNTGSAVATIGTNTEDRKSTRLNSSHANISYAVFCLKKKNKNNNPPANY